MVQDRKNEIIFHIDVNSAFLSWSAVKRLEEGDSLDLRTIPAIVGGDQEKRHGIVVARSIPAKAYGIKTADTVASAFQRCPNLTMVSPDFPYYRAKSHALMAHLSAICPEIEQVSIDECYMSFEPIRDRFASPEEAAYFIKDSVRDTFGFTVNVGISDRKVLAKMASDFQKPDKVHTLYAAEIQEKMWKMPVGELFMCGKSSAKRFEQLGIRTIGELARSDRRMIESLLKSHGTMLWDFANGIDDSTVVTEHGKAKGVGNSTTLANDLTDSYQVYPVLKELCRSVSQRLKKQQFLAGQISVEIKYASFRSVSHQMTLLTATAEEAQLYRQACTLFDELWNGEPVRLLGVRTTKLAEEGAPVQLNIFDYQREKESDERREKLDAAMDSIRQRFGKGAVQKGSMMVATDREEFEDKHHDI